MPHDGLDLTNLTRYEILALDGDINVSDGHPRQSLTTGQQAVIDRLPELFHSSAREGFADLESRAQREFLHSLGQLSAPVEAGRVLSCYSSSVAMEVVARSLSDVCKTIGLIHPTFDNIPDLLRGRGIGLVPLDEQELIQGRVPALAEVDAVFLTVPNNPTGAVIGPAALRTIAESCAGHGKILVLDTSFRGFVTEEREDTYALLDRTGVHYVIIEDTGKLWPLSELKLGFIGHSAACPLDLYENLSDVLLSVSPFVLALVAEFADEAGAGGYQRLHTLVSRNRRILREALEDTEARLPGNPSDVSVSMIDLPAPLDAGRVWADLKASGLHVLRCEPFYWAAPARGSRRIRVALARDSVVIEKTSGLLRDYFLRAQNGS
ncbi:aminotransferase class I/II-fold pyridoxal phosphate-dependent enzyme [Streptomyces xanthophaeus]